MPGPAGLGGLARRGSSSAGPEQGLCVSSEVPLGTAGGCQFHRSPPPPPTPGIPASSGPFNYGWVGGVVVASWPIRLTRAPPSLHATPLNPTASNLCLPCGGTQHQHGIVPFPALPTSRSCSAPYSPRPHPAGPCYTDPTSAEASESSPWRDIPKQGARRAPVPSLWTPLPAHQPRFQLLCLLPVPQEWSRQEQAGQSQDLSSAVGFLKVPSQVPYHTFLTKSTFVASPTHQTQRTPSPTCLQVPAEPGWARPSPSWHCLIPSALLCWTLYLWITKAPVPS